MKIGKVYTEKGKARLVRELHFCYVHTKQCMWLGFKLELQFIAGEVVEKGKSAEINESLGPFKGNPLCH